MKHVFLIGVCTASIVAVGCSGAAQPLTSPTAALGSATTANSDGSTLKVNAPPLINPIAGVRAEDRRPTLVWGNSTAKYGGVGMAYDIELSTPAAVVYARTVGDSPDFGAHLVEIELDYDTVYSWRVRPRVGNEFGPWSGWETFLSPTRPAPVVVPPTGAPPGACAAPVSPMGAGETRRPRPNHSAVVRSVADARPDLLHASCQEHGGNWEFMDRAVDALRSVDGRYGYNAKRGNTNDPSVDVVSYFYGADPNNFQGSPQVYIFDVIGGHCGSNPFVVWNDVTDITFESGTLGRTIYPRPGRNVAACAPPQ